MEDKMMGTKINNRMKNPYNALYEGTNHIYDSFRWGYTFQHGAYLSELKEKTETRRLHPDMYNKHYTEMVESHLLRCEQEWEKSDPPLTAADFLTKRCDALLFLSKLLSLVPTHSDYNAYRRCLNGCIQALITKTVDYLTVLHDPYLLHEHLSLMSNLSFIDHIKNFRFYLKNGVCIPDYLYARKIGVCKSEEKNHTAYCDFVDRIDLADYHACIDEIDLPITFHEPF
jgi:hypothetical protein